MRDGKARVPTPQEFDRLMAVISKRRHAERNTAIMFLSYGLGMRVGEIAAIDMSDILNADGTIKEGFTIKKSNTKTKKPRELYLASPKVRKALADYVAHLLSEGDVNLSAPLFMSQKGQRFSGNTLQTAMATIYAAAGLEGCKSHSGRRTFATKLIHGNTDIKSVQTLMGHASIKQTVEYVENSPHLLKKIAARAI